MGATRLSSGGGAKDGARGKGRRGKGKGRCLQRVQQSLRRGGPLAAERAGDGGIEEAGLLRHVRRRRLIQPGAGGQAEAAGLKLSHGRPQVGDAIALPASRSRVRTECGVFFASFRKAARSRGRTRLLPSAMTTSSAFSGPRGAAPQAAAAAAAAVGELLTCNAAPSKPSRGCPSLIRARPAPPVDARNLRIARQNELSSSQPRASPKTNALPRGRPGTGPRSAQQKLAIFSPRHFFRMQMVR